MDMVASPDDTMPSSSFVNNEVIESTASTDLSAQSKDEIEMVVEQTPSTPAASAPVLIPSLKGVMTYSGGLVTCKGKWALSDEAHGVEGQSNDFEFKLIKADADSAFFPVNGKYQGFFLVKQAPPAKGNVKIEDKDMIMKFESREDGAYAISGDGHNKLGKFTLRGTLLENGAVHLYREYYQFNPPAVPAQPQKKIVKKESTEKKKDTPNKDQPPVPPPPVEAVTPREGGRIRKQSSYLKEFHDPLQKPIPRSVSKDQVKSVPSSSSIAVPAVAAPILMERQSSSASERSHRLNPAMKKCGDLLKELSKLHQASWFLEPVDPIKYNIPDYPKIIKTPMDFSTIRKNIENGVYLSINEFAEHMRLVFRNAVTYNQARDSLVNIAAREISSKFEDKFRILITQLDPNAMVLEQKMAKASNGIKRTKSRDSGVKFKPGPRPLPAQFAFPPVAAVDGSTMKILEMQQMIHNMQDELKQLRTVVKESEISKRINESKEAAQNPLTFEEKKALVGQIHKLTPDKMERVLSIIQEAMPDCAEGLVEVPIDSLDTLTLRKLQQFVQANVPEKKKRSYTVRTDGSNKKPRKARTSKSALTDEDVQPDDTNELLFDNQDELLFEDGFEEIVQNEDMETDQFVDTNPDDYAREIMAEYEKLRQRGNQFVDTSNDNNGANGLDSPHDGLTSSGNDVEEDDDDNLWNEAAAEMQNNKPRYDDVYHV